ncbi:MAG: T9SS type A sorting domain-containing protein, partial [Bacteroidota bacterium]
KGFLPAGSTVNDTSDVDNGYSAELMIKLDALGYGAPLDTVQFMLVVFDPDGFKHPMNAWDHSIGSYYKSWWGSEWSGTYRSLKFTAEPFEDPDTLTLKVAAGTMTFDGKLDEADWTGAPTLVFGMGAQLKKAAGEYTVTAGVDVKNPFTDQTVEYRVPHTDSTLTRVKFLQKGTKLYIGIQSDDKSICKFDWEGDGLFMVMKTGVGQTREFKLYWQNIAENKDTMKYEEQLVGSGMGKGFLPPGSTVNDTSDVDNGYQAELMVDLVAMGYYGSNVTIDLLIDIFDPDGFKHPMNAWDHTVGSYYKSWWGSEWGGVFRTLKLQSPITGVETADLSVPSVYTLGQNYPNPFNPSTTIQYGLPTQSMVTLKVYDVVGRVVATLVNGEIPSGSHEVAFNAHTLASGLYFYRLSATPIHGGGQGPFVATKKLVLLK